MNKLKNIILSIDMFIDCVTTAIIIVITIAAVFMRKVMGNPFPWIEEVQLLLFIWAIFFGGSAAFRTGSHVGIDIVAERLPKQARKILDIFIFIVTTIVLIYFFKASYGLTLQAAEKLTPYLRLPYSVVDIASVLGCALMIIQNAVYTYDKFTGKIKKEDEE